MSNKAAVRKKSRPEDRPQKDSLVTFSKALSYILRHGAEKEGITLASDGYVLVDDIVCKSEKKS